MLLTIGLSVLLSFTLGGVTDFPIGGGIGDYLVAHLTGVMGSFGVILLLILLFALYLVFEARIDFNGSPAQIRADVVDHFSQVFRGKRPVRARRPPDFHCTRDRAHPYPQPCGPGLSQFGPR